MPKFSQWFLVGVLSAIAFGFGRYSAPTKIETKTVEVVKVEEEKHVEKKEHKVVTVTKEKDRETVTTVTDTETRTDSEKTKTDDRQSVSLRELRSKFINFSLAMGAQKNNLTTPFYGVILTKEVLGPITIGLFGFNNMSGGVSVGLNF